MSAVIVNGARTPMGRLLGSLKDFPATTPGAIAIKAALCGGGGQGDALLLRVAGQ